MFIGVNEFHMVTRRATEQVIDVGDGRRGFDSIPKTHCCPQEINKNNRGNKDDDDGRIF